MTSCPCHGLERDQCFEATIDECRNALKAKDALLALEKSKSAKMREALEKIRNKENWGYFDESGCPKGNGMYTDSWIMQSHPIAIAKSALAESGEGEKA